MMEYSKFAMFLFYLIQRGGFKCVIYKSCWMNCKDMSFFNEGELCVIGCSTSEVIGQRIVSVGSMEIAKEIKTS